MSEREAWEAVDERVATYGDGTRPSWVSITDRDYFHGLDEACWPAPLQDVGALLASARHEIAPIFVRSFEALDRFAWPDRFVFLPPHLAIANIHVLL